MNFEEWLEVTPQNEDWNDVWGAVKNLPNEGPFTLWGKFAKKRYEKKKETLENEKKARKEKGNSPDPEPTKPSDEELQSATNKLLELAEKGRKALIDFVRVPGVDLAKQFSGEELGDPIFTLLRRGFGKLGDFMHWVLVKVLHIPAMWKFFRHDSLKIGKDAVRGAALAAKYPTEKRAWGAAAHHLFNLIRLPIASVAMGVSLKLTYQQYQLLQTYGITDISVEQVGLYNLIACYFLFLCFLIPKWVQSAENKMIKAAAFMLRHLFPQQMYKHAHHHEGVNMGNFKEWLEDKRLLVEDVSRYSIEVNYRTSKKDVLNAWAKLVLGFVSSALQKEGYHVKHVYTDTPMRILVSTNNWDDGAWTAMMCYNPDKELFVISSGFWNKDRRTVSIHRDDTNRCAEDAAADLVRKLMNFMHDLRKREPRKLNTLNPAPMKRGPKK